MSRFRVEPKTLLNAVSVTTTGESFTPNEKGLAFHAYAVAAASTGSAYINIMCSNNNTNWMTAATFYLSATTAGVNEGLFMDSAFAYYRADLYSVTGTVSASMYVASKKWN